MRVSEIPARTKETWQGWVRISDEALLVVPKCTTLQRIFRGSAAILDSSLVLSMGLPIAAMLHEIMSDGNR